MATLPALLAALLATAPPGASAQGVPFGIVTGRAASTDQAIGRDLAALGAECGLELTVAETAGSLENAAALRDRPGVQLGIVQSDVLDYLRAFQAEDPDLARIAGSLRIAVPLYGEEVHLLARDDIATLADLQGRRVAVGLTGSDTAITAQLVLDLTEVAPRARVTGLAPPAALDALLGGEIDAMFHIGGAPTALFADDRLAGAGLRLVPLTDPVLAAVYTHSEIAAGSYAFQDGPVATVSVRAVLMAYDFAPARNAYNALSCAAIGDLTHLIASRLGALRETGHPKWRDVDPTAIPPGWEVSPCALAGLAPDFAFTCVAPDGTITEEGGARSAAEPNALFLERICARLGC